MHSHSRRSLLFAVGLLALPLALASSAREALAQTKELVICSWPDPYKAAWYKSLVPNFEKKYNVKVVWVEASSSSAILAKVRASRDKPEIDISMLDDGPHFQGVSLGLYEEIDFDKLPNIKQLLPVAREGSKYGVLFGAAGVGLWYNERVFNEKKWAAPTSWNDFFRPELNKRVTTHTISNSNAIMVLLALNDMAGGKFPDNMEPGWAKMKELGERVVTFDAFGETATLIQQEAAVLGNWNNDRVWNLIRMANVPIKYVFPKEGAYGWREAINIPKGRSKEQVDLAHKFIDMMLSKEQQEANARDVGFIPFHPGVTGFGTETEVKNIKFTDWATLNPLRPAWTERWAKEIERKK